MAPGPGVDDVHARSLRAALLTGETLEITDPGESEDVGVEWGDPRALSPLVNGKPTQPWSWHGPPRSVTGQAWGGCIEVIEWILTAGRFPFDPDVLNGGVLIVETSEKLPPARNVGWIVRSLGERGILAAVDAVLLARPPVSDFTRHPSAEERARLRAEQRDVVVEVIGRYSPDAVVCSASRLVTRARSGSSRTAASSPLTAPPAGWPPTTHNTHSRAPHQQTATLLDLPITAARRAFSVALASRTHGDQQESLGCLADLAWSRCASPSRSASL